ncbi:MAG: hypothetical protein APF76_07760 [Desulfitibacter sp. BRH_c19]|nr:MAG: hypothetical protein APF76_07760 [Desulfitibacter sp. BRH_c19]
MNFLSIFRKNEKGQGLVSFALVLPILAMLIFGIIQFGFIFYSQITITSAAREGARMASVGKQDQEIINKINSITSSIPLLTVYMNNVTISNRVIGSEVEVFVPASVEIIVPILDKAVGDDFIINAKSTMRNQAIN